MEERKKLTQMLKDFQAEQKELLAQAEQRLEVRIECQNTYFSTIFGYFFAFKLIFCFQDEFFVAFDYFF